MFYGMGDSDGMSDLAAFEMGQLGQLGAEAHVTDPGTVMAPLTAPAGVYTTEGYTPPIQSPWTSQNIQKIAQSIQDVANVYAQSLQTQALAKYGPKLQPGAQQQLPGQLGPVSPQPTWVKPAMIVGGLALGGLALWYLMKKRKVSSNPGRDDGWHTIGD